LTSSQGFKILHASHDLYPDRNVLYNPFMVHVFAQSARHALRGIVFVWKRERNFKILSAMAVLLITASIVLRFSFAELMAVLFTCAAVLVAELINTIVEEILDVIEPHYSVHVGRLKDVTAGVVLLLSVFAATIGVLTVVHHYAPFLQE